ncbi:MAG: alpha/beta family hydrolase [Marinobacter sp.]|uniref:alpha/beta family hydrolase n=1 Tax=Marinobacter sp. TaxID=50741 RepID=UPI00299F2B58|nr:alpha/beta family hydrolase [Marinobacter sp.]MDX1632995.1 alpha/beta family hydrolase [Marinobacter sp.]
MNFPEMFVDGDGEPIVMLAHGAGAPADSPFMNQLAGALADEGLTVLRFEFPYMRARREDGRKRPPGSQARLMEAFAGQLEQVRRQIGRDRPLFIGGKSMGGRLASMLCAEPDAAAWCRGAVCFGYPFHPPGRLDRWRTEHLSEAVVPVTILQGTRDPFGKLDEVSALEPFGPEVKVHWLEGGDHDYRTPKRQGASQQALIRQAAALAAGAMAV